MFRSRMLRSALALAGCGMMLTGVVQEVRGQCWPELQARLHPDSNASWQWGSVSISDGVTIMGVPIEDSGSGEWSGAAYIYRRAGGSWELEDKIVPWDLEDNDLFGRAVAISGRVAVISAPNDMDDLGQTVGSVSVYRHYFLLEPPWSIWTLEAKLTNSAVEEKFGESVAIDGDTLLVGAPESDDNGTKSGAVYAYHFNGSEWILENKLLASDGAEGDHFGNSVSVSGSAVVIGAERDDTGNGIESGSAYVYFRVEGDGGWFIWLEQTKLLPNLVYGGAYANFGSSVSISGDVVVIGAPWEGFWEPWWWPGAAYVFEKPSGGQWADMAQTARLEASPLPAFGQFGYSVSIDGDVILIGQPDSTALGESWAGAVYLFEKPPGGWVNMTQTAKLTAFDSTYHGWFGAYVAIDGWMAAIRAPGSYFAWGSDHGQYIFQLDGPSCLTTQGQLPDGAP